MSQKGESNTLRIVGGCWRSRRIRFEDAEGLRPTPDRVRETLFNWLQMEIVGATCLDAFAGSGALGFEAASRGAAQVVMLEKNPKQFKRLKENAEVLQAHEIEIVLGDALVLLSKKESWWPENGFEVIFLDPPFHKDFLNAIIKTLLSNQLLKENAFLYIETEQAIEALELPPSLQLHRKTRAGLVNAFLLRVEKAAGSQDE